MESKQKRFILRSNMKKTIKLLFFIVWVSFLVSSCTKKIPIRSWSPPTKENLASKKINHIVIMNLKKGNRLHDIFASALRESLSGSPFVKVTAAKSNDELKSQLELYNFTPQMKMDYSNVAYLYFQIFESYDIQRLRKEIQRTLYHCNHLAKKNPCRKTGTANLKQGVQKVNYNQAITVDLKRRNGEQLIPTLTISKSYASEHRVIPDYRLLQQKVGELAAKEFVKQVLPYRAYIDIVLLKGDSIALTMIMKGAYSLAFKRLERLFKKDPKEKTAKNLYLQAVVFEIQGNLTGAKEFYHQASLLDKGNKVIQKSLKRVEKSHTVTPNGA
jgi:hypothetical protein